MNTIIHQIPPRNPSANTTAKAIFEIFFIHNDFPLKIHSDIGANLCKSTKLCKVSGQYHPLSSYWKWNDGEFKQNIIKFEHNSHRNLTHAYNAAVHDNKGLFPIILYLFDNQVFLFIPSFAFNLITKLLKADRTKKLKR